jgi:hypothetical protein
VGGRGGGRKAHHNQQSSSIIKPHDLSPSESFPFTLLICNEGTNHSIILRTNSFHHQQEKKFTVWQRLYHDPEQQRPASAGSMRPSGRKPSQRKWQEGTKVLRAYPSAVDCSRHRLPIPLDIFYHFIVILHIFYHFIGLLLKLYVSY